MPELGQAHRHLKIEIAMCQYITITLPKQTRLSELIGIFSKYEMSQRLISNSSIEAQFANDIIYLNTTSRMCDCDSVIASNAGDSKSENKFSSSIKKMEKKGWSRSKIERWLNQKENSRRNQELQQDKIRWTNFLSELLNVDQIGKVGLLVHWYELGLEE